MRELELFENNIKSVNSNYEIEKKDENFFQKLKFAD